MSGNIEPVSAVEISDLKRQWDAIAEYRDEQLRSGKDLSFDFVLKPAVIELSSVADMDFVLDAGCGSGLLSEFLAKGAATVIGVDMSRRSVEIARSSSTKPNNVSYIFSTVEEFSRETSQKFSLVVANMVLQDAANLGEFLNAVVRVMRPGSYFVATITHPWFWPAYWGYEREKWFSYRKTIAIKAPFITSLRGSGPPSITTHFHRPLSEYVAEIRAAGLQLDALIEPFPSAESQKKYPREWEFPRFMAFRCRLNG